MAIATRNVPYHRALITDEEIAAVTATLRSGWLTSGPRVSEFEARLSSLKGGHPVVAVNSCTSGLFLALQCLGLKPGDEVITTPMTFVATANVIYHAGGKPVFADISRKDMNLSPERIRERITPRTRAILPVHVGGNPCDMGAILDIAAAHGLEVIEDCAHALEGEFGGRPLGTFGMASAFSFYPTKNITTVEGGAVLARDEATARTVRILSRHGLDKSTWQRMEVEGTPLYDVLMPGFKCNMSDLQATIGLCQLDKLDAMYARRAALKATYDGYFGGLDCVDVVQADPRGKSSLHLYLMLLNPGRLSIQRDAFIAEARAAGIELSVNYTPIHLFTWYRNQTGLGPGALPEAEHCGRQVVSLPFYPAMSDEDAAYVGETLVSILRRHR